MALAPDAAAQAKKKATDPKAAAEAQRNAAAAAQQAYASGVRAFESGDLSGAEQQLSVALAGGGLPNAQMARALYYRGSAYRQLGRPAQAISDLTTAIWLKGGLSDDLKTKATEARKLAYQEAGLGTTPPAIGAAPLDQATKSAPGTPAPAAGTQVVQVTQQSMWSGISMPSVSMPSFGFGSDTTQTQTAQAAVPAQPAAGAEAQPQSSGLWGFLPSFGGSSSQPAENPVPTTAGFTTTVAAQGESSPALGFESVQPAAAAPQTSAWDTQTAAEAAAQPAPSQTVVASYVPPPDAVATPGAPAAPAPSTAGWSNPLAGTGDAVTGFFSNMFGSSQQPAQDASAGVTTGSTEAGWSGDTTVVTSQTSSMVQRGPESPPAGSSSAEAMPWSTSSNATPVRVATAAPAAGGRYKLQVAAVRSREEAERLAQSLSGYAPVQAGAVSTEIDETVIGSMGTFYRVRLGPYADAKEPTQLCATLKPQGFDCLVVTQ